VSTLTLTIPIHEGRSREEADLRGSELLKCIRALAAEGMSNADISAVLLSECYLPEDFIGAALEREA
jgi:hypothetical protein